MVLEACGRGYADRKLVGRLKVRQLERKADAAAYEVLIEAVRAEVEAMAVARQTRAALMLQMLGRRWAARSASRRDSSAARRLRARASRSAPG